MTLGVHFNYWSTTTTELIVQLKGIWPFLRLLSIYYWFVSWQLQSNLQVVTNLLKTPLKYIYQACDLLMFTLKLHSEQWSTAVSSDEAVASKLSFQELCQPSASRCLMHTSVANARFPLRSCLMWEIRRAIKRAATAIVTAENFPVAVWEGSPEDRALCEWRLSYQKTRSTPTSKHKHCLKKTWVWCLG